VAASVSEWQLIHSLTLAATIEFFNLILETHLTTDEKTDLEAFLRVL
jgi:hypothetical protein